MHTSDTLDTDGIADLEKLGAELAALGYHADVRQMADRLPYLHVRNPDASALSEKVYVQGDSFWWSWAERIAGCNQAATAAGILARVLRTISE
ncbi:MAG TPA: hypothetical protein VGH27_33515 [Streptosporangiaceae bacterium]|jgi:hypothetical protein